MAYIRNLISVYISNFDWVERQNVNDSLALSLCLQLPLSFAASVQVSKEI